jgi:hypothetical protein
MRRGLKVGRGLNVGRGLMLVASAVLAFGQATVLPEPARDSGSSITGSFEGWFKNPDGSFSLLLGYYNRNRKQEVDIPAGPDNALEPGGPDRGQPTHFMPGRGWGLFTVQVPADFGDNKITWTIVANGKSTAIPASLKPDWEISPFREAAVGNTPPVLSFDEHGPSVQGPRGLTAQRTAKLGEPLTLTVWVSDDAKFTSSSGAKPADLGAPVTLRWIPYRGPGRVAFSTDRPAVRKIEHSDVAAPFSGTATTTATFSEPGEYEVLVTANDYSGDGGSGFQCCWTTGQVKVRVQP